MISLISVSVLNNVIFILTVHAFHGCYCYEPFHFIMLVTYVLLL